jgi:tetratricopeptide (TPR) repeat protein
MAGNRGIYNAAMKQAQAHAWEAKWRAALKEYQRAAEEFPDDLDALMGIATANVGLKRWKDARKIYEELSNSRPKDLVILERLAEIYVETKDISKARAAYFRLSGQYVINRKVAQAITAMERIGELLPQDEEILTRLAHLYREGGNRSAAIETDIERIRFLFREERLGEAMSLCEEVLQAAPDNRQARELLFRLRREMSSRKERGEEFDDASTVGTVSAYQMEEWVRDAAERQEQGDVEGALRLYERASEAGLRRADVSYSLGLLYKDMGQIDKAIEQFHIAASSDEYALSSHYTLGECYRDQGDMDRASQEFERALHLVDLQTIGREAVDDLIQMYEAAADVQEKRGDLARAATLYTTLAGFLQGKRWRKGLTDKFRQRAQELTEKSMYSKLRQLGTGLLPAIESHARGEPAEEPPSLDAPASAIPSLTQGTLRPITDFLRTGGRPGADLSAEPVIEVKPLEEALSIVPPVPMQLPVRELDTSGLEDTLQELVEASRVYLERGLFNAAIDMCCEVIQREPSWLPIHMRLGEVYERQDRPELAMVKYQALVNTYLAREEKEEATEVYKSLLSISPDNVSSRGRLAELLIDLGKTEEAVHQMLQVAQTYFRLGQTNRAIEKFREVRSVAPDDKNIYLEYGLFLLKMDRPEAAIGELRRALQIDAQDSLALARMNIALALLGEEASFWDSLETTLGRAQQDEAAFEIIVHEYRDFILLQEAPLINYAIGLVQRQGGLVVEAVQNFRQAYQYYGTTPTDPMQLRLCWALAEGYLLLGQTEDAIEILQKGLEWAEVLAPKEPLPDPDNLAAVPSLLSFYHWLAEAYTKANHLEQAVAALVQAKASYPFDRGTSTKLADLYFRQGNLSQALSELNGMAQYYEQKNQLDRALEILQHMSQLAPSNLPVRKRLAHLCIRRGYIEKGLTELESLSDLQRKRGLIDDAVQSLQQMAEIFWTMGRHDRAYQVYDRIVQLAPKDIAARQQLINLHILAGRLADALEEQRSIARITVEAGQIESAVAALHQVLALDPQDRWALRQLADLLSSIGEHSQAVRLYRRLIQLVPNDADVATRLEEEERLAEASTGATD